MDLLHFLKLKESPSFPGIFIFKSNSQAGERGSLLGQYIFDYVKKYNTQTIRKVDANLFDEVLPELYVSFLGDSAIYWISGLIDSDDYAQKKWLDLAVNYSGPHTLILWEVTDSSSDESDSILKQHIQQSQISPSAETYNKEEQSAGSGNKSNINVIEIPAKIDINYYNQLYALFYVPTSADALFAQRLFKSYTNINTESAVKIMHYQATIGRKTEEFFQYWISKLIAPEKSLFTLSQYLFSKQSKEFFAHWQKIKEDYPDEFWVSYWSGQIWQAATFITIASTGNILEAKKAVYGLPFSFINKDWRSYDIQFLSNANKFLYTLDYNMKNGCTAGALEVWFNKFLLRDF